MGHHHQELASEISRELEPIHGPLAAMYSLHPHHRSLSNSQTQFSGWSMVSIRDPHSRKQDDHSIVFPPINHEGLHVSSTVSDHNYYQQQDDHGSSYSPSEENSLAPPPPPPPPPDGGCEVARLVAFGFDLLWRRVNGFASSLRHYASLGRANWSFSSAAGVGMALVLWWFYMAVRRRRQRSQVRRESRDHLILLIKEKDQKINQLLHQIAQMNQLLLALHRDSASRTGTPT